MRKRWISRLIAGYGLALSLLLLAHAGGPLAERAVLVELTGVVGPATVDHVRRTLKDAAEQQAALVIIRIDTPGGLDTSMRALVKDILASPVPVVTWVAPGGARAASAGTYILLASHGAAMAASTHLGAATPVTIGGMPGAPTPEQPAEQPAGAGGETSQDDKRRGGTATERKMLEDAVSYIRGLAERHGRNADWAEQAVREGHTLTSEQAKAENVIDLLADDLPSLLQQLDGREVRMASGELTLHSAGLQVIEREQDWRTRLLAIITNPSVAYFLMLIGFYGIIFELSNPGQVFPGVIGAICLVLALYAFQVLPVNYAGLALIILGLSFMVAEAFVPSFGVLGLGGVIAFIVGSVILMDDEHIGISLSLIVSTGLLSFAFLGWFLGKLWRIQHRPVLAGNEELLTMEAIANESFGNSGWVRVHGEIWRAHSDQPVQAGEALLITRIDGLTLQVTPKRETR